MNKKLSFLLAAGVISLSACGSDESSNNTEQNNEIEASDDTVQQNDNNQEEENTEEDEEQEESVSTDDDEFGSSMDENGESYEEGFGLMRTIGVGYNDEIKIDGSEDPVEPIQFGDVSLSINGLAVVEIEPEEDISYLFDEKELVRAVIIDMELVNGTEEDITFHPNQSVLVTSAGEQVESDMMLMDDVGGDIYSGVKKSGQPWWILESLDDDIDSITMIIDPPYELDSWDDIGEEKRLEFEILNWEDALERDGRN